MVENETAGQITENKVVENETIVENKTIVNKHKFYNLDWLKHNITNFNGKGYVITKDSYIKILRLY